MLIGLSLIFFFLPRFLLHLHPQLLPFVYSCPYMCLSFFLLLFDSFFFHALSSFLLLSLTHSYLSMLFYVTYTHVREPVRAYTSRVCKISNAYIRVLGNTPLIIQRSTHPLTSTVPYYVTTIIYYYLRLFLRVATLRNITCV